METENRTVGAVPVLVVRASREVPLGSVLWYHGFGVDKHANLKELEVLAGAGFDAFGIDVVGHGGRRAPDLDERMNATQEEALSIVVAFATATAQELPGFLADGFAEGLFRSRAVSLVGISMGAFVVYRAVVEMPTLRSAVALLGSPEFTGPDSPHLNPAAMCSVPLLSVTGECDTSVPPAPARRLHTLLDTRCAARHRYVELRGAEHLMDEASWNEAMKQMIAWLQTSHEKNTQTSITTRDNHE